MTAAPSGGRRAFWGLLAADSISLTGNNLTMVAIPWFVLQTTGSPMQTGIAGSALVLPNLIAGVLGGPLVDRLGYRKASIIADLASGVTVAIIPVLYLAGGLNFGLLLALVFAGTFLDIPGETARRALLPDVVGAAGLSLERATSTREGWARIAGMVGGPLAAFLIAVIGAAEALFFDAATFGISAFLIWWLIPRSMSPAPENTSGYLSGLREGLRFVWNDRLIRAVIAMVMVTNLLDYGASVVLLTLYADQLLGGPGPLGLIIGALGVGTVLGAFAYGRLGERWPKRMTFLVAFALMGAPRFFILAAEPGLAVILPAYVVLGMIAGVINPLLIVVAYERIPADARGRVIGVLRAASWGAMPVGTFLAGYLAQNLGLIRALLIVGGVYLLASLSPAIGKVWAEMDRPGPNRG